LAARLGFEPRASLPKKKHNTIKARQIRFRAIRVGQNRYCRRARWICRAIALPVARFVGLSLEKRNYGETIDNVASSKQFHHRMAGNFPKYGGNRGCLSTQRSDCAHAPGAVYHGRYKG